MKKWAILVLGLIGLASIAATCRVINISMTEVDGNAVFGHDLDDVDRLFAAVMRLAVEGHLAVDTSAQFSDATSVMWRETRTERSS